jgi:hypothetical protein
MSGHYIGQPYQPFDQILAGARARVAKGERVDEVVCDLVEGHCYGWGSANARAIKEAAEREAIYRATAKQFAEWYPAEEQHPGGQCVRWTCTAMRILMERGYRPKIQAGSMSWPIVTPEQDDGVSPTHFTYEWSPHTPESQARMEAGGLPEVHVWLALPDLGEILDFSTKFFPEQSKRFGLVWQAPPPPDYLWWGPGDVWPATVQYKPNMEAIAFIINYLRRGADFRGRSCVQTVRLQQINRK